MTYFKLNDSDKHAKLKSLLDAAPKPQLHLHLDGSLSFNFIENSLKRLKARNKDKIAFEKDWEPTCEEDLVLWMMNLAKGDQSQGMVVENKANWKVFAVCNYFLQTEIDLVEATCDLVNRMALQHCVNYIEIRFAPVLHTDEGLTEDQAVHAAIKGFRKAQDELRGKGFEVKGGLILCALRSFPVSEAEKTVRLIQRIDDEHVLGFDIAGDEGSYPLKQFEEVLKLAVASKINVTVHAGEWNEMKHDHVIDGLRLAVDCGVQRIGHGLALRSIDKDDELFQKMAAKKVSVEICITSNCDDANKCLSYDQHPISKFLQNGVTIAGLNVDNLLLAGNHVTGVPDPSGELTRALMDCGLAKEDLISLVESSYRSAFVPLSETFIGDSLKVWKEKILPNIEDF